MTKPKRPIIKGLGARLTRARGAISQEQIASTFGLSRNAYGKYEADINAPGLDFLVDFCRERDVSLNWLVLGIEPIRLSEIKVRGRADGDARDDPFLEFYQAMTKTYEDMGIAAVPEIVGADAGALAADVIADGYGREGRDAALKQALKSLRGKLRGAAQQPAEPSVSKRSA